MVRPRRGPMMGAADPGPGRSCKPRLHQRNPRAFNTFCKKPYMGFLLYDNAIYSNIRV